MMTAGHITQGGGRTAHRGRGTTGHVSPASGAVGDEAGTTRRPPLRRPDRAAPDPLRAGTRLWEEDQPFRQFGSQAVGQISVDVQLLDKVEAVMRIAGPDNSICQLRCETRQGGEIGGRYVVDIYKSPVIVPPWKIRSANSQFSRESGIFFEETSGFDPPLSAMEGFSDSRVPARPGPRCPSRGRRRRAGSRPPTLPRHYLGMIPMASIDEPRSYQERRCEAAAHEYSG